jgi:hypothetical protein
MALTDYFPSFQSCIGPKAGLHMVVVACILSNISTSPPPRSL